MLAGLVAVQQRIPEGPGTLDLVRFPVSGAVANASGMFPSVNRWRKYTWNRMSVFAFRMIDSSGAWPYGELLRGRNGS